MDVPADEIHDAILKQITDLETFAVTQLDRVRLDVLSDQITLHLKSMYTKRGPATGSSLNLFNLAPCSDFSGLDKNKVYIGGSFPLFYLLPPDNLN